MQFIDKIVEYFRLRLIEGIQYGLGELFGTMNRTVGESQAQVMQSPAQWNGELWGMINDLSSTVILPVAGIILTCICCIELITIMSDRNNLHNSTEIVTTLIMFLIKLGVSILAILKTPVILNAFFDLVSYLVGRAGGFITGSVAIDPKISASQVAESLQEVELFEVLGVFAVLYIVRFVLWIISLLIQVIVIGRMIEIYMYCSLAPIPISSLMSKEVSDIGKNYFKGLAALAFQGFLMMLCIGIYAVLVTQIVSSDDVLDTLFQLQICSLVLCFTLFKTGQISKSIFSAH